VTSIPPEASTIMGIPTSFFFANAGTKRTGSDTATVYFWQIVTYMFTAVGGLTICGTLPNLLLTGAVLQSVTYSFWYLFFYCGAMLQNYRNNYMCNYIKYSHLRNLSKSPSIYFIGIIFYLFSTVLIFYFTIS
jgi:hypothetical protein